MESSRFEPIHYKARKLLEEERFHFEHARGWVARLGATQAGRDALHEALEPAWLDCLRGFGPSGDALAGSLADAGITSGDADALRGRWLERVGPVVEAAGLSFVERTPEGWASARTVDWEGWSSERRRNAEGGPDPETLARVRGDRNRALLMD